MKGLAQKGIEQASAHIIWDQGHTLSNMPLYWSEETEATPHKKEDISKRLMNDAMGAVLISWN